MTDTRSADRLHLLPRQCGRRMTPLALALWMAFPADALAQAAITRPPAPPPAAVPRPMPGWRVSGTGAAAPVNQGNAAGGTDQTITQTSQRGIYNWQTFDIGSASSVTFSFAGSDSSALNRVVGSTAPSLIFGAMRSVYANPTVGGAPLTGGSIYLINANGILFGRTAQVNTGALIASTLNLSDADFASSLTRAITEARPAFTYQGAPELFTDARNFVAVDPGATITTTNGGRVFLFARNVQNGGAIRTPGGQTVLAAGSEIYLNDPTAETLYASEVNPAFPALRGLLVEVGQGSGTAANLAGGVIDTPRGNTTLVGMAVNQSGRISATTSVSENGSVLLLARGNALASTDNGVTLKHATTTGTLTLGAGSRIEIAPDTTPGADGRPVTSDGNSLFTTSRVELSGKTIELQAGASIVAPGGIVDVRAESQPYYPGTPLAAPFDLAAFDPAATARLVLGDGARIDVSGTTSTEVSAARNFATSELIGRSDLADAPLQQSGPLYRSRITFDIRGAVPILGDTRSYVNAIQRSAAERLANGGTVTLMSSGSVVTHERSLVDVAGGTVTYTEATVTPTRLIAADGTRYTLGTAPRDIVYTGIEGASRPQVDRWGVVPQYQPAQSRLGQVERGYVDGRAGGTLNVVAPISVLDGRLDASTTVGLRQSAGQDSLAAAGSVAIGLGRNQTFAFGDAGFTTAGVRGFDITRSGGSLGGGFWIDPLGAVPPDTGRIAATTIDASGLGRLAITADGSVALQFAADLVLAPRSTVSIAAAGSGGIDLGGSFRSAGGSFSARTADLGALATAGATRSGAITLQGGRSIDVSGEWVNRALDGADAAAATPGGSVSLVAARGLDIQDASRIDVSGGATVAVGGAIAGTAAGSISLAGNTSLRETEAPAAMHVGAALRGDSLVGGGTLSVRADRIDIGTRPAPGGIRDGTTAGSLVLSESFFRNGAFTTYDIGAVEALNVLPGTTLAPLATNWLPTAGARFVASGTDPASFLPRGVLPDAQRAGASVRLTAVAPFATPTGSLAIAAGAAVRVDPGASIDLAAGSSLVVDGTLTAPGGAIALGLRGGNQSPPLAGTFRVGGSARLDANGTTVLQLPDGGPARGTVLSGGSITLAANSPATFATPIEVAPGAVLSADGASARVAVSTITAGGATRIDTRTVDSAGGSITIRAGDGGAALGGDMHAHAGGDGVAGGAFSLSLASTYNPGASPPVLTPEHTLVVQQAAVTRPTVVANSVIVSASQLSAGFADISLQSADRIRFSGDVSLAAARNLVIDAPDLVAAPNSRSVDLFGASTLQVGSTPILDITRAYTPVGGNAALQLRGGLVVLRDNETLQGFGAVAATAGSEIRLQGTSPAAGQVGRLSVQADLTLSAPLIAPTSNSHVTIDAPGQRVLLTGGDATRPAPLSAGGSIAINAREISTVDAAAPTAYGVVRAPLGALALNASERVVIGDGSVLSVAGAGLTIPFGSTTGGAHWAYGGQAVTAPPVKSIDLVSPGRSVGVSAGATLDLSGGGDLVAFEFVPGPGGSRDVFAGAAAGAFAVVPTARGYAPRDADILGTADASGARPSAAVNRQISFGANGPVPAGSYAVLPARYALLPGAFLVTPVASSTPLELGAAIARPDGSTLVGGRLGDAGTAFASPQTQTFQVRASTLARTASEIRASNANDYFASAATGGSSAVPRLPIDAGRLDILADQLTLRGRTLFAPPADARARGGEIDIAADRIRVATMAAAADAGVLTLAPADLNATGAALVVLGGVRNGGDVAVTARSIEVDNGDAPLRLNDLTLVATGSIALRGNSSIVATGSALSEALHVTGDGALLRVSSDPLAGTQRSDAQRAAGDLLIGAGVRLSGGAVTAEATHANVVAAGAQIAAESVTLGGSRIAVGLADPSLAPVGTTVLTPALAASIGTAQSLTLRSFDGIDLYGSTLLGGSALRSLTLDAGTLRVQGSDARARIEAGTVRLTNSSGSASSSDGGSATLAIVANGNGASSGQVVVSNGALAVSGVASLQIDAAREVVVEGQTQLSTAGDLRMTAAALQGSRGAQARLASGGTFTLDSAGRAAATDAGPGAHLAIDAARIEQGGRIDLPSGELALTASGTAAGAQAALHLAAGSQTLATGRSRSFDGTDVATPGGDVRLAATSGSVAVDAGALVDVSAAPAAGSAGTLSIAAPLGSATLAGDLRATAALAESGGRLRVDSATPIDLGRLATSIGAGRSDALGNFAGSLDVRNRSGDQSLAAGSALVAHAVALTSDQGRLTIAGSIDASGVNAPRLTLSSGGDLAVASGATLTAHSTGSEGADLRLSTTRGVIDLAAGARIDASAGSGGQDGALLLRAPVTGIGPASGGTGVAVAPIAARVDGVRALEIEAVRTYASDVVDGALIARVNADNAAFASADGGNAQAIRTTIANGNAALLGRSELRAGVEIRSAGDLVVSGNSADGGWNLTRFAANGMPSAQPSGAPVNLTLRATGSLLVEGSLSDGFTPAGATPSSAAAASRIVPAAVVVGEGGRMRLVGGADLGSADPMAVVASPSGGDVAIGSPSGASVLVRSTTGSIDIAAGRDVVLLDRAASVYTTGLPQAAATLDGFVGTQLASAAYLLGGSARQAPFLGQGGSISVAASRDLVGATGSAPQYGSDWLWRSRDLSANSGQATWWSRYDRFRQGIATFGGGSVRAEAGRDATDVEISAASSGYVARNADGSVGGARVFGGGDIGLHASRDVVGGFVLSGRGAETVSAGRAIVAPADPALQVLYGDSQVRVEARNGVDLGAVAGFGLIPGTAQFGRSPAVQYLTGVSPGASLVVLSTAGDLVYRAEPTTSTGIDLANPHAAANGIAVQDRIVPDRASFTAFAGSADIGPVVQVPGGNSHLQLFAQGSVVSAGLTVTGTKGASQAPLIVAGSTQADELTTAFRPGLNPLDLGERQPVRVVAVDGDTTLAGLAIVRAVRVIAGRDIALGITGSSAMELQHQAAAELSLLQAGRDIVLPNSGLQATQDIKLHGPGDLVVAAGRNVEFGTSGGIGSIGNRENASLAAGGARITVLSGLLLGRGDYTQAAAWYFPLLGGTGVAGHAADLYAQLAAARAGQPLPPLGGAAAADFSRAPLAQQIDRARAAVGDAAFDAAVLSSAQRRANDPALTLAQARTTFAALAAADQSSVMAAALANAWSGTLTRADQIAQVLAMAATQGSAANYQAGLVAFVQAQTGRSALTPAQALDAFAALAPERQLVFTNSVLFDQVRSAGRAASLLVGADRDAAYARAYAAIDTVFPNAGVQGDVKMGSSQVKSLQSGEIVMLAPRGGVDVGELASGPNPKKASELGIVTAAGGDISMLVRDDVLVNQSRVFAVGEGNLLMWASDGNLDAGRGAKTVTGAPPPVFRFDAQGNFVIDTSGSFTGSGIAVLNADSTLDLYAPKGEINAGDAGIKSLGNAFFGAARFVGADNLSVGGLAVGAPPPPATGGGTAGLAAAGQAANTAANRINPDDSEEEKERKRRRRLNLILEFLGFGDGTAKP